MTTTTCRGTPFEEFKLLAIVGKSLAIAGKSPSIAGTRFNGQNARYSGLTESQPSARFSGLLCV